jgi:hypothetical protein
MKRSGTLETASEPLGKLTILGSGDAVDPSIAAE